MGSIINLLSENTANAIAWTIIHSLWQASLVALVMSILLKRFESASSSFRYRIALFSLYAVFGMAVVTFSIYYFSSGGQAVFSGVPGSSATAAIAAEGTAAAPSSWLASIVQFWNEHFYFIANTWLLGFLFFAVRFAGGYAVTRRLSKLESAITDPRLTAIFNRVLQHFDVSRVVRMVETDRVRTPMMIGYLKPVILMPLGIVNQLETHEVEAILAHELGHVVRNDFLGNLIQSAVEVLLYYHPAVWWISANIRAERENCCDDLAVQVCGNAVDYAKALVKLQEWNTQRLPSLAIPLSRNRRSLLERVSRILNQPQNRSQIREKLAATLLLFSAFVAFATDRVPEPSFFELTSTLPAHAEETEIVEIAEIPTLALGSTLDTMPKRKRETIIIKKETDERDMEIKIEDGEVKSLTIDGEEVPEERFDDYEELYERYTDEEGTSIFYLSPNRGHGLHVPHVYHLKDLKRLHGYTLDSIGPEYSLRIDSALMHLRSFDWEEWADTWRERQGEWKVHSEKLNDYLEEMGDTWKDLNLHVLPYVWSDSLNGSDWNAKELRLRVDSLLLHVQPRLNYSLEDYDGWQGLDLEQLNERLLEHGNLWNEQLRDLNEQYDGQQWLHFFRGDDEGNRFHFFGSKVGDRIIDELWQDDLLEEGRTNTVELTGKHLKINGEKQPSNIWKKYKKIYEEHAGHELTKKSKIEYKIGAERPKRNVFRRSYRI